MVSKEMFHSFISKGNKEYIIYDHDKKVGLFLREKVNKISFSDGIIDWYVIFLK